MQYNMQDPRYPKSKGQVILEYVLLAICLCVIALRTTFTEGPTAQSPTLPGNVSDVVYSLSVSAVLIFSFIFWLVQNFFSKRFVYRVTGVEISLGLFVIAAVAAGFTAANKRTAISDFVVRIGPVLMAVLLVQILDSQSKIKLVLVVIAALGVVSACECANQLFITNQAMVEQYEEDPQALLEPLGIEPGTFSQFMFEHRLYTRGIRGFFTTRNSAGSFALIASFAAIALFIDKFKNRNEEKPHVKRGAKYLAPPFRRGYSNLACGFATAVVIFSLVITRSKGAIIGWLFAATMFVVLLRFGNWLRTHRKAILVACILLAITGAYLVASYGLKHGRLPGGSGMLVRWQYWHASGKMYADHPITGIGPGNFSHFYTHYKPPEALESVADPHNFALSVLTQYGPLGLAGFLAMILLPLSRVLSPTRIEHRASSIDPGVSPKAHLREPTFRRLAIIYLIVISAALLFVRPMLMPATPADTVDVMIYLILTLYVVPAAVFVIAFLLLTAPLRRTRHTRSCPERSRREAILPSNRAKGRNTNIVAAVLLSAVLGVLAHNLIDFAVFEPGVFTTLWAMIAVLIALDFNRKARPQLVLKPSPAVRIVAVTSALVLIWAYLNYALIPVATSTGKIQQAYRAVGIGQFAQAHDSLAVAADKDRLDPAALNLNGRLYLQHFTETGEKQRTLLEKAQECFLRAIDRDKASFKNYEKLSTVYDLLGETQNAYDWCLKATKRYPGSGRLRFKLAKIAEKLGKTDVAIEEYGKAIEIEEEYRAQFRLIYPEQEEIVSRLGEEKYQFAKQQLKFLTE